MRPPAPRCLRLLPVAALWLALPLASTARAQVADTDRTELGQAGVEAGHDAKKHEGELSGVPALFSTPETGVGGGAVLVYIPPAAKEKVSSMLAGFLYTARHQLLAALYTEQYFADDRWAAEVFLSYQDYPDEFFGLGDHTRAADQEAYVWKQERAAVNMRYLFTKDFRAGFHVVDEVDGFSRAAPGPLADGGVFGAQGGAARGVGVSCRYDDLDDTYSPRGGSVANLATTVYTKALASDYAFQNYELNLKHFTAVGDSAVVGAQVYSQLNSGDPPFVLLGELGGKNLLRGYYLGRYRDREMVLAQAEYRQRLYGRIGGVVFAGVGEVAHDLSGLDTRGLKPSEGFGLRYQLTDKQKINVRVDFGFAPNEPNPSTYVYILEAF